MNNPTGKDRLIKVLLTPFSFLYGTAVWVRNKLFDCGLLREVAFDIPVVSIGNLTVGGTGKTPHVEYIVSQLAEKYNMAVLSRGYKRKTKGYIEATIHSTPQQIGDEPMQIYNKFGSSIKVAVCENRRNGITELIRSYPDLELIILDDAFQHRWVKPKVSILLSDYSRPIYEDTLLPLGRLREPVHSVNRADMVIITKCPDNMNPIDYRVIKSKLNLMAFQKLYFSHYEYGALQPVFSDDAPYQANLSSLTSDDSVMLLTGIARPRYFIRYFRNYPFKVKIEHFPDHHDFTRNDIDAIKKKYDEMSGYRKIIVTTEKDAVRLANNPYFPRQLKPFVFYLPITVKTDRGIDGNDFVADLMENIEKGTGI